ncbi:MAG: hypothetical protein KGJ86_11770, partial [Chloroflexota bacterium]|nr:hypothetical protein [Chloroflexota bacterium]
MNNELEASDMTSALVDAALSEQIPPVTYADVDDRLGEILWDLTYLGKTVSPSTAFRRHLESAISAQLSGNNIPARRAGARHWSFPTFARWWRLPASALAVVTVLLSAAWFSPQARAQLGWLVCYVPGLGIQACDTTGLVMTVPVSVTRGGQTLTVTDLLSSGGQTLV